MRPFVEIFSGGLSLGGIGVGGGLSDRLLSVECVDEAEDKSDRITIRLDDRARWTDLAVAAMPVIGQMVTAVIGYREGAAHTFGPYLIDDLRVSSPPREMTVTGRSAAMPKSYRTPRTESYHQMTLGAILQKIAGRNGYSAAIDPDLAGIVVRHADQRNESDMAFATRLAGMHDGVARPVAGRLCAAKKGTGKNVTGKVMPPVVLSETECSQWEFSYSARDEAGQAAGLEGGSSAQGAAGRAGNTQASQLASPASYPSLPGGSKAGGVRAFWNDIRTGELKEVTVGDAPYHDLRYTHHNEAEAQAAVEAYKNKSLRGKCGFTWAMGGRPSVLAECPLILNGFRAYIPSPWRIKSAVHRVEGNGGYTVSGTAELFAESQGDVPKSVKKTTPTTDDKIDPDAPPEPVQTTSGDDLIIDLPE